MSEMRLRHKKPINSYVGQANYDSNQAQDEDFANKNNLLKKTRLLRQRPTNDQTRKYAEILCQFVHAVNLDYRNHIAKFPQAKPISSQEATKHEKIQHLGPQKLNKDENYVKAHEVVSKQQQKIRKLENIVEKQPTQTKKIKKDRQLLQQIPKNKETKEPPAKLLSQTPTQEKNLPPSHPIHPMQSSSSQKTNSQQISAPNMNYPQQIPTMNTFQQVPFQQMQQLYQNSLYGMNPTMYSMYPYAINPMFNYQFYPQQMTNLMTMYQANMNYIPFSRLPFVRNPQSQPEPRKQQSQPQKIESSPQSKPQIQQEAKPSAPPQQQAKKTPQTIPGKIMQPIDFKRKSCHHVAIAYNIYYTRLKQKGLFNNMSLQESWQKLDPTFPAKQVKKRKRFEGNTNDTSACHS